MMLNTENWRHFRYFSKDPSKIIEKVHGEVTFADIPVSYLSPTQSYNEFLPRKEKTVKTLLKESGVDFLRKWPIITCALPSDINNADYNERPESQFSLLILDGHHRKRFAPKYGVYHIPSVILNLSQTALAYEIDDLGRMADILVTWQSEAFQSAALLGVNLPQPKFINFARNQRSLSPIFT